MKKRTKQFHYSSIAITLSFGIVLAISGFSFFYHQYLSFNLLVVALILFFCTLNAFIFRDWGRIIFAFIAGVLIALLRLHSVSTTRLFLDLHKNRIVEVSATISSDPSFKDKTWRFSADHIEVNEQELDGIFYISLSDSCTKPQRGDRLILRGKLLDGFGEYSGYLARPTLIELSKPDPPDFSLKIREAFSTRLKFLLGEKYANELALGLGYLTGQKDSMPEFLNEKLRRAGLAHVVVASGFHLGLIANLAKRLFKRVSRFAGYSAAFMAIVFFVSITGFSASMLRAGIVISLSLFASYFGRKFHPARLLLFVGAITLLYKPQLCLNVGWQLSFASFAGLLFFAPLITDYFFGEDIGVISQSLIQTISAQLFCLPISIYAFGSFSPIGLISNLVIPPTIPLAMLLCFGAVVLSFVPEAGLIIAYFARHLLSFHVGIVDYLSHFDWASISLKNGDTRIFWLYPILILTCIFLKWRSKHCFKPSYTELDAMEKSQKDVRIYAC